MEAIFRSFEDISISSWEEISDPHKSQERILRWAFLPEEFVCTGNKITITKPDGSEREIYDLETLLLKGTIRRAPLREFIVPNPFHSCTGTTKTGKSTCKSDSQVKSRRFLIIEFDFRGFEWTKDFSKQEKLDHQASLHWHLACEYPLCLLVYSGNESVHGWFATLRPRQLMTEAASLGADNRLWSRSQFTRMPWGRHANGERQRVIFFKPENAAPCMKTTTESPPPKPGATPENDRDRSKFAHESREESGEDQKWKNEEEEEAAEHELKKVSTKEPEQLEFDFPPLILPGYLYQGRRLMFSGKPITGKGLLLIQTACCVATGEDWLGVKPAGEPKNVLHLDFELMEPQLRQRIEGFIKVYAKGAPKKEKELRALLKEHLRTVCLKQQRHLLFTEAAWKDFARRAGEHKASLLSLDPCWRVMPSERIEEMVNGFLGRLDWMERTTGVSTIYAQHQTKGDQASKDVIDRFAGLNQLARDASTIITMLDEKDIEGCFLIEARTNDFAQPEKFHIIREYPIFRRLAEEEFLMMQGTRPGRRDSSPEDLLALIPPFASDLGKGPKDILRETLVAQAKGWEPSMGKNKCEDYLKILKEQKRIDWAERKADPREAGRGLRYFFRTKPGI